MKAPDFWQDDGIIPRLLSPLAALYAQIAQRRMAAATPVRLPVPVICVGNITVGGTGKTPVTLALARLLQAKGHRPHVLSRGYGGREKGPIPVAPHHHSYRDVGDEPLLLARAAPTWVGRDRIASARAAVADGATVLILDDGFQNPALVQDLRLVVVDGGAGFGNGRVMPAGPLREPIASGLARAHGVIVIGPDRHGVIQHFTDLPLARIAATLEPGTPSEPLRHQRYLAFAGIGRPQKFYDSLKAMDALIVATRDFPDHYPYRFDEMMALEDEAVRRQARLATTEKDWIRLPIEFQANVAVLPVHLTWSGPGDLVQIQTLLYQNCGIE